MFCKLSRVGRLGLMRVSSSSSWSSACRNKVGDLPELPEEIIERYRKADAAEIRTVRLDGRSAPTARRSATSHDGKMPPGGVARL